MLLKKKHSSILWVIAAVVVISVGCASKEATTQLPFQEVTAFSSEGVQSLSDQWWQTFNDVGLDRVVEHALNENFSLRAAYERLRAARALALRQSAEQWPELELSGGGERVEVSGPGSTNRESSVEVGLAAAYELDLWGRLDALADAEAFRADAAQALLESSALSVSGEVALAWYRLAGAKSQRAVLTEQIETNREVLDLLNARFQRGQIRAADVLRQRQLVEATVEQANDVDARIILIEHLLATLQGQTPQLAVSYSEAALVQLPPLPDPGLPSELLQRRPDVREAFYLIQAADAELAAAISERYPRINLSASLLTSDGGSLSLFESWLSTLAGQVALPVFDGGERRAEVVRRRALLSQQIAEYGETVLTAFREVEDALASESYQRIKVAQLEKQLSLADQTYAQLRNQYLNGVSDYIDVLDALREQQLLARELVAARQILIEFRIALHRAIAGGLSLNLEENVS